MRLLLFVAPALVIVITAVEVAWLISGNAGPNAAGLSHTSLRAEIVGR